MRSRDGPYSVAAALGEAIASADWKWFLTYVDRIKAVTRRRREARRGDVSRARPRDGRLVRSGGGKPQRASRVDGGIDPGRSAGRRIAPVRDAAPRAAAAAAKTSAPAATAAAGLGATVAPPACRSRPAPCAACCPTASSSTSSRTTPCRPSRCAAWSWPARRRDRRARRRCPRSSRRCSRAARRRARRRRSARCSTTSAPSAATRRRRPTSPSRPSGMARDLPLILDVLADELRHPAFAPAELAKAKASSRATCCAPTTDTPARAMERLGQLAFRRAIRTTPPGAPRSCRASPRSSDADLREFHRAHYVGAGAVLAIVGDVDATAVIAQVTRPSPTCRRARGRVGRGRAHGAGGARSARGGDDARQGKHEHRDRRRERPAPPRPRLRGGAGLECGVRPERARLAPRSPRARHRRPVVRRLVALRAGRRARRRLVRQRQRRAAEHRPGAALDARGDRDSTRAKARPTPRSRCRRTSSPATTRSASARTPASRPRSSAPRSSASGRATSTSSRRASARSRTAQANAALRKHLAPDKLHVVVAGDLDRVPD